MNATPFRIVHLSDLHLTASPGQKRFEAKFSGQLTGMNNAFRHVSMSAPVQNADLVLITGDVTDLGDLESWGICRDVLVEAGLKSKTIAIIGNHDVCGLGARLGWPDQLAQSDLKRAGKGLELLGQSKRYPWAKVVDPRVVIIGMDTNNSGNLSAIDNAVGRIGERQLQRFSELLSKHRDIPVKIVALHHSPNIPMRETAIRRGQAPKSLIARWTHQIPQDDRRALRRLCVATRVRLVVHGHLHEAEDRRVNGIRMIGAPASTQPIDRSIRNRQYAFFQYTVRGRGGRVDVEKVTV